MGDAPYFFDRAALVARGRAARDAYRLADPFPHVVLDDFLPLEVAAACADEFPGPDAIPWDVYTDGGRTLKLTCDDESRMPPAARQLVGQFNSGAMISFLEELTGITGLVADPHLGGGGLHRIEPGGFLDVHADFNKHALLGLDRRLNVLYYLNPEWDDAWEGHLELWDRGMQRCVQRIAPVLNRCVVFSTTSHSFHGHPHPLACPPGQARKSLAFYYYTNGRPAEEAMAPHSTLYQVPGRAPAPVAAAAGEPGGLRAAVGRRLPPGVKASVKRAARKVAGIAHGGAPGASAAPAAPAAEDHWSRINRIHAELVAQGRGGRANYTWSLLHAGDVARTLGIPRITAIELGVAGGNGLVALEAAADAVVEHLGVGVDVVGFDHGTGLPPPEDYRDAPYLMEAGQFPMDEASLRARLRHASLHLGLVRDTVGPFLASDPAPIGFVAFDLDYYSSTMDALRVFDAPPERFLPRVLCYFDDILGYPWGESNGPRLAIRHFNEAHEHRVLDFLPGLRYSTPPEEFHARWVESMYVAHVLDHPRRDEDEGVAIVTRLDLQ
jgi:hypothetical protein